MLFKLNTVQKEMSEVLCEQKQELFVDACVCGESQSESFPPATLFLFLFSWFINCTNGSIDPQLYIWSGSRSTSHNAATWVAVGFTRLLLRRGDLWHTPKIYHNPNCLQYYRYFQQSSSRYRRQSMCWEDGKWKVFICCRGKPKYWWNPLLYNLQFALSSYECFGHSFTFQKYSLLKR